MNALVPFALGLILLGDGLCQAAETSNGEVPRLRANSDPSGRQDASIDECRRSAWFPADGLGDAENSDTWEVAVEKCKRALATSPDSAGIWAMLGRALYKSGQYDEGKDLIERSAKQGHPFGQYALGYLYDHGQDVDEDPVKAAYWYQLAANQGYAAAQFGIGMDFHIGRGLPQNDVAALEWIRKASNQGYTSAESALGWIYEMGWGVPIDYGAALDSYRRAVGQQSQDAALYLAAMYVAGRGVPRNFAAARKLIDSSGAKDAKRLIAYLDIVAKPPHDFPQRLAAKDGFVVDVLSRAISAPILKVLLAEGLPVRDNRNVAPGHPGVPFLCRIGTWRFQDRRSNMIDGDRWAAALLQASANPNELCPSVLHEIGYPPSVDAIAYPSVLARLLNAGGDPNASESGDTLVWLAVEKHALSSLNLLLDAGADPNAANRHGELALALAAQNTDAAAFRALIAHGARVSELGAAANVPFVERLTSNAVLLDNPQLVVNAIPSQVGERLTFSPDNRFLLATGDSPIVSLIEVQTGRLVRNIPLPNRQDTELLARFDGSSTKAIVASLSPNSATKGIIALDLSDGTVIDGHNNVGDPAAELLLKIKYRNAADAPVVRISYGAKYEMRAQNNGFVELVDAKEETRLWSATDANFTSVAPGIQWVSESDIDVSADGGHVVYRVGPHIMRLRRVPENDQVDIALPNDAIATIGRFSPDASHLIVGGYSQDNVGIIVFWDIAHQRIDRQIRDPDIRTVGDDAIAISPNGKWLAVKTGNKSTAVSLIDLADHGTVDAESLRARATVDASPVRAIALSDSGSYLTAVKGKVLDVWELSSGNLRRLASEKSFLRHAALLGDQLYAGSSDGSVLTWDIGAGTEGAGFNAPPSGDSVQHLFTRAGYVISEAGIGHGYQVSMWTAGATSPRWTWTPAVRGDNFHELAASSDGQLVFEITCDANYEQHYAQTTITALRITDGVRVWQRRLHDQDIWRDPGSCAIATAAQQAGYMVVTDGSGLWVLSSATGDTLRELMDPFHRAEHLGYSPPIALSSDGATFAAGIMGGSVALWDVTSGREIDVLPGDGRTGTFVTGLTFFPDTRRLAVGSFDDEITVWDLGSKTWVVKLISFEDGKWLVAASDGRYDSNSPGDHRGASWVLRSDPMMPLPIESFMKDYYEPGLLAKLLRKDNLPQRKPIANLNRVQPLVSIVDVSPIGDGAAVNVTVEVREGARKVGAGDDKPVIRTKSVQDLRVFRDGQLVASEPIEGGVITLESDGVKRILIPRIRLPRDQREQTVVFSAYAFNETGVKSLTATRRYKITGNFKTVVARAYVISIGLNRYANSAWHLRYAANDACEMQQVAGNALWLTKTFDSVARIPLISGTCAGDETEHRVPVDKQHIAAVFDILAGRSVPDKVRAEIPNSDQLRRANPEDLILISYSGHGATDSSGEFYLFPYDAKLDHQSSALDYSSLISSTEMSNWLRGVDSGELTMIIDACHSAASIDGDGFVAGPTESRGFGQMAYDKGMRLLAASEANAVAFEFPELSHGLLTYSLLDEGLKSKQAYPRSKDGRIPEESWLRYGERRVPALADDLRHHRGAKTDIVKGVTREEDQKSDSSVQHPRLFDFRRSTVDVALVGGD